MNLLRRKTVTFVTEILKDVIYYRGEMKRIENQHGDTEFHKELIHLRRMQIQDFH